MGNKKKSLAEQYSDECRNNGVKVNTEVLRELMRTEFRGSAEFKLINSLVGKTIKSVDYDCVGSAPMTLRFTDGSAIEYDATGDDAAHLEWSIINP